LKEQMITLSSLLPGIIADGLPSEWLLIETMPRHELPDHSFDELFQPSGYSESSEQGCPPSAEPSQSPMDIVDTQQAGPLGEPSQTRPKSLLTVDTQRADTVLDPSLDPRLFNQSPFHGQDVIESAQGPLGHRASEDLELPSPTAGIDNGTPRDFTSEGEWSTPQGGNWKVQQPFGQYEGQYSPPQGGNWKAQPPFKQYEGQYSPPQCGNWQAQEPFDHFEGESTSLYAPINLSPLNSSDDVSASSNQSPNWSCSSYPPGMPQASQTVWNTNSQDPPTIDPVLLLPQSTKTAFLASPIVILLSRAQCVFQETANLTK